MIVSVLGILYARAAYAPLDMSYTDDRIGANLAGAEFAWGVGDAMGASRLRALGLTAVDACACDRIAPPAAAGLPAELTQPAYIIQTSGSVGTPKRVVIARDSLARMTAARRMVYSGSMRAFLVSPLVFDSSVAVIWGALTSGGLLAVASEAERRDPTALLDALDRFRVSHLLCVPALYALLLDEAERQGRSAPAGLTCVTLAGEAVSPNLACRHHTGRFGHITLVNEYGPTETTVWASYARLVPNVPVTIGGPVPGVRLKVADAQLRPVTNGEPGELLIGGAGVCQGYHNDAERTRAAFVRDPQTGELCYRSGDKVRWLGDALEFLGRFDEQVKVRGHRVDLSAVDTYVTGLDGFGEARAIQDENGELHLFLAPCAAFDEAALRARIREAMGEASAPARITRLDALPRTVSGKADRDALRALARPTPRAEVALSWAAPLDRTRAERLVASAWADVLGRAEVPGGANFFDLGGHSVLVFRLQDRIEQLTGRRIPTLEMFRSSTVGDQAAWLCGVGGGTSAPRADCAAGRRHAARERRAAIADLPDGAPD